MGQAHACPCVRRPGHGGAGRDSRLRGDRGPAGRCSGPDFQWQCRLFRRWPRRQGGRGIARACALGFDRGRACHAGAARHGQSRPCRHAERGQPLRPADCTRHYGFHRRHPERCAGGLYGFGRIGARWIDHGRGRLPACSGGRQCARTGADLPGRLRAGGRLGLI